MKLIPKNHSISNPAPAQIRAQRDRIMASKGFSGSKRQCAFLEYVVNAALEGQTDRLKEFTLGIEVFEKDESFDPSTDSIVRVEASRLRSKLSEYYVGVGQADSVRIDIPKGHYVPFFRLVDDPKVEHRLPQNLETSVKNQIVPSPSSIAVLPLRDWSRLPEEYFSEAMTDALISSLAEIGTLGVTSLTSVMRYKNTETPIPEIGRTLGVAYILEGSVFRDDEQVRLTAQLIDANTDKHVWSKRFDRPSPDLLSVQSEVTATIAALISNEMVTAGRTCPIMIASAF
jgi:TolB-like protein